MSNFVRGLMLGSVLTLGGCASSAEFAPVGPSDAAAGFAVDAWPSAPAAKLLPAGARYRLVVAGASGAEAISLLVLGRDGRIAGRVRIVADEHECEVVLDDFEGPPVQVDARTTGDRVEGRAIVGRRDASWRVRVDADGSLGGERWSGPIGARREGEQLNLLRARALIHDIAQLIVEGDEHVRERVVLAELSVELSLRAWDRHARGRLPSLASLMPD